MYALPFDQIHHLIIGMKDQSGVKIAALLAYYFLNLTYLHYFCYKKIARGL